jgi:signal transduction histidine kinase
MQSGQIVVNAQGRIQDCNAVLEGMTGLTRDALLGLPLNTLFGDTSDNLSLYLDQLTPNHLNSVSATQESYVFQALDQAPVACLVLDIEGRVLFANPRVSVLLGYSSHRWQTMTLPELTAQPMTILQTTLDTETAEFRTQNGGVLSLKLDALTYQVLTESAETTNQPQFHCLVTLRQENDLPWAVIRACGLNQFNQENDSILTLLKHSHKALTPVRLTASFAPTEPGFFEQLMIGIHPVSSLLSKHEEIRHQHSLLEMTMEVMQDGVVQLDRTGHVLNANPKAQELLGRNKETLLGMNLEDLLAKSSDDSRFPNWIPANHVGVLQSLMDHDPENFWLLLRQLPHPILGFDGQKKLRFINQSACHFLGADEDLWLERALSSLVAPQAQVQLERNLKDMTQGRWDSVPTELTWLKDNHTHLHCTSVFQALTFGSQVWTMVCLNNSIEELKARAMRNTQNIEWSVVRSDGDETPVVLTAAPLRQTSSGTITGVVITLKDMREIKQKEADHVRMVQKMEQSQRLDALGQLAAGVAHDFNNLLGVVQNHAELVEMKLGPDTKAAKNISAILQATTRARDIVIKLNGLGREARKTEEVVEVFDLAPILEETKSLLTASLKGIDIDIEDASPQASSVKLKGDSGGLQQVLVNLCVNASHAIGERRDGRIIIFTSRFRDSSVRIAVIDNGSGIPKEILSRIFEPFYTTKEVGKGTGLGLAMVRSIVSKMGGTVDCESEVGVGTSFIVTLPIAQN